MSQSMKALNAILTEGITLTEAARRFGISKAAVSKAKLHPSKRRVAAETIKSLQSQLAEATRQRDEYADEARRQMQHVAIVTKQRDELLALLEEAVNYTSCPTWSPSLTDEIEEAIANVKGEV